VDFIVDNAVPLSAIVLGALVVLGLLILVVAGLRLWRAVKGAQARVSIAGEALSAEADRLQAALAAMPERRAELQREIASLSQRVKALGVLARHASEAAETLRYPLRYLGR
jgi:hypothetical protein